MPGPAGSTSCGAVATDRQGLADRHAGVAGRNGAAPQPTPRRRDGAAVQLLQRTWRGGRRMKVLAVAMGGAVMLAILGGRACSVAPPLPAPGAPEPRAEAAPSNRHAADWAPPCDWDGDGCSGGCPPGTGCSPGCTPNCSGAHCGDGDGCGGTCSPGSDCSPNCTPNCSLVRCGDGDGCAGSCLPGSGCALGCTPSCGRSVQCGDGDGCSGICLPDSGCHP
jgi:hypothetical protein